jgi:pyrroline-5-carboxylate reductase
LKAFLKKGYRGKVIATRRDLEKLRELEKLGAYVTTDNRKAAEEADIVFLCVKPNDVEKVLRGNKLGVEGKIVISTAATIPLQFYKQIAPKTKFVRTMPNIAALVQESFTAYCCGETFSSEEKEKVKRILDLDT